MTELLEAAADARLVALGSRGLGGFSGMLTGSTVVAMVARGRCPIVVVRGGGRENGPVVLGMDGSPANEPAIAVAFDEASSRGADLVAVHSWLSVSAGTAHTLGQQLLDDFDALEGNERELLAERLMRLAGEVPGRHGSARRRAGPPGALPARPLRRRPAARGREPRPRWLLRHADGVDEPGADPPRHLPASGRPVTHTVN